MKGKLSKLIMCFRELGLEPKVDSFQSKLLMQKTAYLLDQMGIRLGYSFGFYVRGTYSPALTDDLYQYKEKVQNLSGGEKLTAKENKLLQEFKEEMDEMDPAVLEIAATYAYFFKQCNMSARDSTIKTRQAKPFFSEMQFVKGINRAKGLFFKPSEDDLRKLRKEMEPWQQASMETLKKF